MKTVIGDKTKYTKKRLKAAIADCKAKLQGYQELLTYLQQVKPID